MTTRFKLYSYNPTEKSYVNFVFTKHLDNCFECYLPDYDMPAIMPFQLATHKTSLKNKSIKTLAPLHKPFVGIVEEISDDNTVIVSRAFIDTGSEDYLLFEDENSKNKQLVTCVKQYAMKNNINYIELWSKLMYPIDQIRNEFSLFDYIINNKETIMNEGNFNPLLLDTLVNITIRTKNPVSKFKLVSMNGIDNIKKNISTALEMSNMNNILDITIDSAPNYLISSKDHSITTDDHMKFIHALEILAKEPQNGIYFTKI
jgi:hypothetical protein